MPVPSRVGHVHLTSSSGVELALPSTVTVDTTFRTWLTRTARLLSGGEVPVSAPLPQAFDVLVHGTLVDPNAAGARARIDELMGVLADAPVELRTEGAGDDRYLLAYPASLSRIDRGLRRFGELSLQLHIPSPYWTSDVVEVERNGITTQPTSWTVPDVDGNVMPNPVVTVDFTTGANGSNFQLWNTSGDDRSFTVPGTFTSGDQLVVDTERLTVLKNGSVSYLDQMSDSFLLQRWPLSLGNNSITAYLAGTVRMNVSIAYRSRWL